MVIIFDGNKTKNSPEAFPGVTLKSFIHPDPKYNDGYNANPLGTPEVGFSFGLFTIEPFGIWPNTCFSITDICYCLSGEGILIANDTEYNFQSGAVIYIPKNTARIIKNILDTPLKYLSIVDPAWKPEYETVL